MVRLAGGFIFFAGMLLMAYNVYMTIRNDEVTVADTQAATA
jgi:cytochrome c oxidase cbb3-type subunit 1